MFAQKTYHYVKTTRLRVPNDVSKASDFAFTVNVHSLSLPQASAQTFSHFGNSSTACAGFSLWIKSRAEVMSDCFYLSSQDSVFVLVALPGTPRTF